MAIHFLKLSIDYWVVWGNDLLLFVDSCTRSVPIFIIVETLHKHGVAFIKHRVFINKPGNFKLYSTNNREFVDRKVINLVYKPLK